MKDTNKIRFQDKRMALLMIKFFSTRSCKAGMRLLVKNQAANKDEIKQVAQ
jgi:hypothetical protein